MGANLILFFREEGNPSNWTMTGFLMLLSHLQLGEWQNSSKAMKARRLIIWRDVLYGDNAEFSSETHIFYAPERLVP